MPFCKISSDVSLYYITNAPNDDVSSFDHSKPTIMLLHPIALDVTWLRAQFEDPRLTNAYNMIAFDQRNAGRTKSTYSARRDSYVDAADLGLAHELLQLPPVHVFGAQMNSIWSGIRFTLLFPSKCLSLCLCGVPADTPLDWTPKAFADLIEIWSFPPDLETFEQACMEMSHFMFAGQISSDLEDEIVAWWQINIPPTMRRKAVELTIGRGPPPAKEYAMINMPTLLITGDKSAAHPLEEAIKTHEQIPGSQLFVMKGGPEMFQILPQYSGITHRVYSNFLSRLPAPPPFTPGTPDLLKVAKGGLARLAEIAEDPSIALRDPTSLSFSMWTPEVVASNQALLNQMAAGEDQAFSPVNSQGLPIRPFSSRHDDQWTKAAFDKMNLSVTQGIRGIQIQSSS